VKDWMPREDKLRTRCSSAILLPMRAYQKDLDNEEVFRNHERLFSEIICLVTDIIDSSVDESLGGDTIRYHARRVCSGSLFFVVVRCRHKMLRRKVISLLRLSRRLKGLGDTYFLAQVAGKVMELEERKCDESVSAAKQLRISDIDVQVEHERLRALVKYIIKRCEDTSDAEIRDREDSCVVVTLGVGAPIT
jgi:hypothetical protein